MNTSSRKFYTLDALRCIAALIVVQLHTKKAFGRAWFSHAGLAVDFFFMLSGFVLSHAYQERLDQGWSTKEFLKARLVRLYPLYLLGLVLGASFYALRNHFGHQAGRITDVGSLLALGLFLIPAFPMFSGAAGLTFPLNEPTWSLFFEIIANVFHAAFLRRVPFGLLTCLTGTAWIFLTVSVEFAGGMNCGLMQSHFLLGFARISFAYLMGMLVYRLWKDRAITLRVSSCIPAILLAVTLCGFSSGPLLTNIYDLWATLSVFPAILYLGAMCHPNERLIRPLNWMGVASYGIYVLHSPLFQWFVMIRSRLIQNSEESIGKSGYLYFMLLIPVVILVDRFYDIPIRAKFSTKRQAVRSLELV